MKVKLSIKTYKHFFPLLDPRKTIIEDKILAAKYFNA
jgi:hypothetical protein